MKRDPGGPMIGFILRRLAAQRLLGLAMVVTLAFTIGVLVAGPIYADAARGAILSSEVAGATVTVKNVRFTAYGTEGFDYTGADGELREAAQVLPVDKLLGQGLSNSTVSRSRLHEVVPVLFRDGADRHLDLLRGTFPVAADEVAVSRALARSFGIRPGRAIVAGSAATGRVRLAVTGVYGPQDFSTDFWYGSQNPFPPADSQAPSPIILARDGYLRLATTLGLTSVFAWDAYLDLTGIDYDEAIGLPGRIQGITFPDESPLGRVGKTTGLDALVEIVRQRTANVRVPVYLVVFQIGGVALAVLAGVASLALSRQSFELAVLRSRGFTRARLMSAQAVQTVVTAVAGFPLGLLVGLGLARLATRANGPPPPGTVYPVSLSTQALMAGAIGATAAVIILLLLSLPVISRTVVEERRQLSREARPLLARIPVELFVLPLGLAAFYEVQTRGFLPATESGSLDPLVLLAPTLLLFAASFIVLRILLFLLRRLERPIGRARALPAYLAGRRLGRSPGTSFAISLLLVLAVGLLVVSTSYRATVIRNHEDAAHQAVGADWQVQVAPPEQPLPVIDRLPPGATPVVRTDPDIDRSFSLPPVALGIDPATYRSGGWWRADYAPQSLSSILRALGDDSTGLALPEGTNGIEIQAAAPAWVGRVELHLLATFQNPDGSVQTADLGELRPGGHQYGADLEGEAERMLSIVVHQPSVGETPRSLALRVTRALVASNQAFQAERLDLTDWDALQWRGSDATIRESPGGVEVAISPGAGHVLGGLVPPEDPLPALVSAGFGIPTGGMFEAGLGSEEFEFRVIGQARGFPSAIGDAMVVPIRPLLLRMQRVAEPSLGINEVWAMGDNPTPELRRLGLVPGRTRDAQSIVRFLSQLPQSLAVGMHFTAAAGGMGLVVLGVGVGLYFTQRRREFEFASLRAMGSRSRQVSSVLVVEQGVLVGFAVAAGAGLGYAILRLMMPYLGKSLGVAFPAPILTLDWTSLGLYGVAVAAATGLGLVLAVRALLLSSVTSVLRGEAE